MFTNLDNINRIFDVSTLDSEKYIKQRKELGISDIDLLSFTEYLDGVIYNGIARIVIKGDCIGPDYMSEDEWKTILEKIYSMADKIYKNDIAEVESDINSFNSYEECLDHLNHLSAENYALRSELFKLLNTYHDYIYLQ